MKRIGASLIALLAASSVAVAQTAGVPIGPSGGGSGGGSGGSYTNGSGLSLTGTTFSLGDANLTYSAGALATTSLALGGATIGANKFAVNGSAAYSGGSTNSGTGSTVSSYYNATGNKQLWIGDPDYTGNSAGRFFRITTFAGLPAIDLVNGTNTTSYPIILGSTNATGPGASFNNSAIISTDGVSILADRNSTNAQAFRVGGSFTDSTHYCFGAIDAGQTTTGHLAIGSYSVGACGGGGSLTTFDLYADNTKFLSGTSTAVTTTVPIKTSGYTVTGLPSGVVGMRAYVTDQTAACPAAGGAFTGSGAVTCPAFYNGSAWVGDST